MTASGSCCPHPVGNDPRCEFVDAIDCVVSDASKHETQIPFRIDAVEFCGANEAINCGSTFAAGVGSSKQIVASTDGHPTQCALDWQIVDFEPAILAVSGERSPPVQRIENRPARIGFARERFQRFYEPRMELIE